MLLVDDCVGDNDIASLAECILDESAWVPVVVLVPAPPGFGGIVGRGGGGGGP